MTPKLDLESLPQVEGFRQRGTEMTRLETFTDAAFAFALTMLVISFDEIPASFDQFAEALKRIPAFAASFAQIAVFWYAHHIWSRRFGLDDLRTAFLSLLLVFVTLVFVYPLRIIFSAFFHWLTNGYLPFEMGISGQHEIGSLFVIYGIGFTAMSGCILLLYSHAMGKADALALDEREVFLSRWTQWSYVIYALTGTASAVTAMILPQNQGGMAGFAYATLGISMPWFHTVMYRRFRRRWEEPEPPAGDEQSRQ